MGFQKRWNTLDLQFPIKKIFFCSTSPTCKAETHTSLPLHSQSLAPFTHVFKPKQILHNFFLVSILNTSVKSGIS